MNIWPKVRAYWRKVQPESDFRDWWETVYEQLFEKGRDRIKTAKGRPSVLFSRVGRIIMRARIEDGLSQKIWLLRRGMNQPAISRIEEGRQNVTMETLACLCKVLNIKSIKLETGS